MKNVIMLIVFSFLLVSCNKDKPKPEFNNHETPQSEVPQNADSIKTNAEQSSNSDCTIDVVKLDSTVWVKKEYTVNYIMDVPLPAIDSATVHQLLKCGVLDESRRTTEIEGELYEYPINYFYYNVYQLDHYCLLTLLEENSDGPEFSFIAVSIDPETNRVMDSKYMLSIWLNQLEANFTIDFYPNQTLAIFKNTKRKYSTTVLDSLEVSVMDYYYEVGEDGKLNETMLEDIYYKCTFLDEIKGLINDEGKRENVLYAILPEFDIKMNNFYYGEELPDGDYELFTTDRSDQEGDILLKYNTGGIYGGSGSPFRNELKIIAHDTEFEILKVEQQYTTNLLFSEDGSGGLWTIDAVKATTSDWVPLEQVDSYVYKTLSKKEMAKHKKSIGEGNYEAAEDYVKNHKGEMEIDFYEDVINAFLKITYTSGGKEKTVTLQFDFSYGD
ncbi:MAG: hypothetical protein ACFFDN_03825 [Candidatus Hodarchaeota archaeon]